MVNLRGLFSDMNNSFYSGSSSTQDYFKINQSGYGSSAHQFTHVLQYTDRVEYLQNKATKYLQNKAAAIL